MRVTMENRWLRGARAAVETRAAAAGARAAAVETRAAASKTRMAAAAARTAVAARTAAVAAFAACLVLLSILALPPAAWADDENVVNPQQRPDSSFIYDTAISALNSADTYYDGQTVQVVGEAVGDVINADVGGSSKWINLSAEEQGVTYSIAVFMSDTAASRIDTLGSYGKVGTTLQVRGTFHLVCPEHDGVTDIHANVVSVVDSGSEHPDAFSFEAFIPGIVAVVAGLVLMGVFYRLRERQR